MNSFPSESPLHSRPSLDHPADSRMSDRNGAIPMPVSGAQRPQQPMMQGDMGGPGPMGSAMPRSPPKNKNTQHVPCKFFLQGQCQAGRMCPFSHDIESTTRPAPCKYFAKGGCKFGRKCALLHITPDGTVVNRMPPTFGQAPQGFAPPPQGPGYAQPPPGLLSMQAQAMGPGQHQDHDFDHFQQYNGRSSQDLQQMELNAYASASPQFGSPPQEHRFGASPPQKGLSVLDAPLPNSFDSNGISLAARNGPFAASVPSRFGIESPPSSLPRKTQLGNTALRDLHTSAFGMDGMLAGMGSSPPSGTDEPLTFPKKSLHSDRLRASHQMISASWGARIPNQAFQYSDEEDRDTDREEDLLPASLRDLIPEGRQRKEERARAEEETPAAHLAAQRRTISYHGTPQDSKVGSPHSSSPSRYSNMFARAQAAKTEFGSPLRNSGFAYATSSKAANNGELSPGLSSPPRQASMSMLTQELQRTKLDAARSQAAGVQQAPTPVRTLSNGSSGRRSLDRGPSSTSVGKIDEEPSLFDMDEVGGPSRAAPRSVPQDGQSPSGSLNSRALGTSPSSGEPNFGAIGGHRSK